MDFQVFNDHHLGLVIVGWEKKNSAISFFHLNANNYFVFNLRLKPTIFYSKSVCVLLCVTALHIHVNIIDAGGLPFQAENIGLF